MNSGKTSINLKIGRIVIRFEWDSIASGEFSTADDYLPFYSNDEPQISIKHSFETFAKPSGWQQGFESGTGWLFFSDSVSLGFGLTGIGEEPYRWGVLDKGCQKGMIYTCREAFSGRKIPFPFDLRLGQLVMTHLLHQRKGLLMHACAVKDGDQGILFLGNSGHGKSTMARLWQSQPGVTVLSDDRIILQRRSNGYWISGTPWPGDARAISAESIPLTRIYFLKHADKNYLRPLEPLEFSRGIITRSFPTYWYAPGMLDSLQFVDEFCRQNVGFELGFKPDDHVIGFLRA